MRLYQRPAKRPDKRAEAYYLARGINLQRNKICLRPPKAFRRAAFDQRPCRVIRFDSCDKRHPKHKTLSGFVSGVIGAENVHPAA